MFNIARLSFCLLLALPLGCSFCTAPPPGTSSDAGTNNPDVVNGTGDVIVVTPDVVEQNDVVETNPDVIVVGQDAGVNNRDANNGGADVQTNRPDAGVNNPDVNGIDAGIDCANILCGPGTVCRDNQCVPGCEENTCPDGLLCDEGRGENGECVACVDDQQCDDGQRCSQNECVDDCRFLAAGCPADLFCDAQSGQCVQCASDDNCGEEQICINNQCQEGCRDNNGCRNGQECVQNECVDPPECSENSDCPLGTICQNEQCILGCDANNRCGENQVCDDGTCEQLCATNDQCEAGESCVNQRCEEGCTNNGQCNGFRGICSIPPGANIGTCVGCETQQDCFGSTVCDADLRICLIDCSRFGGPASCNNVGGVCDPADDLCRFCVDDGDCQDGRCEGGQCVIDECGACDNNRLCDEGFQCRRLEYGFGRGEDVCVKNCEASCENGFECRLIGDPVVESALCIPNYQATRPTCAGVRDLRNEASCNQFDQCGAFGIEDGVCITLNNEGVCSMQCDTEADCPTPATCVPAQNGQGFCVVTQ